MYQSITLLGNLGSDPSMKYMPSGMAVTNFSMATSESWTTDGERQERTTWWRVAVYGKSAEAANQYLKKGSKVLVIGRMNATPEGNPRVWTDNSDNARASFELNADTVKFLSPKSDGGGRPNSDDDESEIPF